ncbi:uncharacterized protein LOC111884930 isoform X3 [Lactuca sativa]|uniref:uncharacterized protein LOC111884930 isoform X3 n=1 Tax=Lactuca sativa TaxID=4236 RepID=UPI000CD7FCB5|nr:uncharacterized protein LOC111884930 isoform X3 [Lactuca sativa]XP_042756987.1 uncharacterized protein LOC111884930 isoform X3 [Lactuca sativa]XP_042756988.1 uncharacterized protein LOC111884930 isoform X3 [Lactuca sativa]
MHCFDSTMHFGVDMFQKFSAPIAPKIIWAGICLCLHLGLVMIMFSVRVRSRYTTDMGVRLLSSDRVNVNRTGSAARRGLMRVLSVPGGVRCQAGHDARWGRCGAGPKAGRGPMVVEQGPMYFRYKREGPDVTALHPCMFLQLYDFVIVF